MNESFFHTGSLIRYQRISRNLIAVYFSIIVLLRFMGVWSALEAISWGVIGLLVIGFARVLVFAIEFHRARLYRFVILSYLLLLVLLSTIALKYWVL